MTRRRKRIVTRRRKTVTRRRKRIVTRRRKTVTSVTSVNKAHSLWLMKESETLVR